MPESLNADTTEPWPKHELADLKAAQRFTCDCVYKSQLMGKSYFAQQRGYRIGPAEESACDQMGKASKLHPVLPPLKRDTSACVSQSVPPADSQSCCASNLVMRPGQCWSLFMGQNPPKKYLLPVSTLSERLGSEQSSTESRVSGTRVCMKPQRDVAHTSMRRAVPVTRSPS